VPIEKPSYHCLIHLSFLILGLNVTLLILRKLTIRFFFVSVALAQDSWDFNTCQFTIKGVAYNLTYLQQQGTFRWNQTIYSQDISNLFVDAPPKPIDYHWELAICGNVKTNFPACTASSPVNWVTSDGANCTALGDVRVGAIERTPYDDGLMMTFYHGKTISNIQEQSVRIYLLCDPSTAAGPPTVEHEKTFYNWHIFQMTKLTC